MGKVAAIIGCGVIGGGWAARFALMGWEVRIFDPDPETRFRVERVMADARRSLPGLVDAAMPEEGPVITFQTLEAAVGAADWIQESLPERLELKREIYGRIQSRVGGRVTIASSTSGFRPSELAKEARYPDAILVAHPFNPVYLLPLVELVPMEAVSDERVEAARTVLSGIGMYPLLLRREIDAHVADRLLEAVWREALWLVKDGVATTEEVDDAIRYGFGLRWAQMGLFETYRIAGGEAGMRHFIEQFGPALKWPWSRLIDVPELTPEFAGMIAEQSDAQSGARSVRELEGIRDGNLVALMRALKARGRGVGRILRQTEMELNDRNGAVLDYSDISEIGAPIETVNQAVPLDWTDYNGHMNEAKYLQVFGDATDRFMRIVGCDADYVASGGSYFTAETHIRHLCEVHAGARIRVSTVCLEGRGRKMHLFHELWNDGRVCASGEHVLVHVSLKTRRPSKPSARISRRLGTIEAAHAALPRPYGVGRYVGAPR